MDNIRINRLNPDTFEYQTYDITDENLIAQSNLDTALGDQANTSVNVEINRSGGTTTGDDVSAISSGGDSGGGSGASSGGSGY